MDHVFRAIRQMSVLPAMPISILLFSDYLAFLYALAFCQNNNMDVTDFALLNFNGIAVFEDIDVANDIAAAVVSYFDQPLIYVLQ